MSRRRALALACLALDILVECPAQVGETVVTIQSAAALLESELVATRPSRPGRERESVQVSNAVMLGNPIMD